MIKILFVVSSLLLSLSVTAVPKDANGQNLVIQSVVVDYEFQQLLIRGFDLLPKGYVEGESLETIVQVNEGAPLSIVSGTPNELLLDFSTDSFVAGDYLLTVKTGNGLSQQDKWKLTIGAVGPQGEKGEAGPQGEKGIRGEAGPRGYQGPQGAVGPQGEKGEAGPQGEKGDNGGKGDKGVSGNPFGGFWDAETNYPLGQMVFHEGRPYWSKVENSLGIEPLDQPQCELWLEEYYFNWVGVAEREDVFCEVAGGHGNVRYSGKGQRRTFWHRINVFGGTATESGTSTIASLQGLLLRSIRFSSEGGDGASVRFTLLVDGERSGFSCDVYIPRGFYGSSSQKCSGGPIKIAKGSEFELMGEPIGYVYTGGHASRIDWAVSVQLLGSE